MSPHRNWRDRLSTAARAVVDWAGSWSAAALASLVVLAWLVTGLLAGFTGHWFEILFTVTGAITFVMVFVIQHATNRDLRAVLLKLDELVEATDGARDDVIRAERGPLREQERLEDRRRS